MKNKYIIKSILVFASGTILVSGFSQEASRSTLDLGMEAFFPDRANAEMSPVEKLNRDARLAVFRKDWKEAADFLRKALREEPENIETYLGYANFHFARKEYPSSEKALLKAIELSPGNPQAHFEYSRILTIKGDMDGAMKASRRATELAGERDWIIWAWEAKLLQQGGRIEDAKLALDTALTTLRDEIKRIGEIIYRYEGQREVTQLIEESDVVGNVGGGFTEVPVAYFETQSKDAPDDWELYLESLKAKLASLQKERSGLN